MLNLTRYRMLITHFSQDQSDRYDLWRRVKLEKASVKKVEFTITSTTTPSSPIHHFHQLN